jgi:hypothetical protein
MTEKELIKLFSTFKDAPELGGGFDDTATKRVWSRLASELGFSETMERPRYSFHDYAAYAAWRAAHVLLRPVTVGLSTFLLVFGGWVMTVNAAFDTVPGDFLYPVKRATERVQLSLANNEQRVRLHTEFASRRLDEVLEISQSSREGKDVRVREAVESFEAEVASAGVELEQITASQFASATDVLEAAIAVDRKVNEYAAVLAQPETESAMGQNQDQVADALSTVQETDEQVTEVIIASHEATQKEDTARYLKTAFKVDLFDIEDRRTLVFQRMRAVESAYDTVDLPQESEGLSTIKNVRAALLSGFDESMVEAMNLFAAGGFRRVLEIVNGHKNTLAAAEGALAIMEINITTAQTANENEQGIPGGVSDAPSESQPETLCSVSSPCSDEKVDAAESGESDTSTIP